MTSAISKSKKKSSAKTTPPVPAKPTTTGRPNTRKELRTSTLMQPTASSRAKVVPKRPPRPKPQLVRTKAVKSGLSTLAKEAVERYRAREAQAPRVQPPPKLVKQVPPPSKLVKPVPTPPKPATTVRPPKTAEPVRTVPLTVERAQTPPATVESAKPAEPEKTPPVPDTRPAPPVGADVVAQPVPKSRRAALISTSTMLRDLNAGLDDAVLRRLYTKFYDVTDGIRWDEDADVYNLLGEGDPQYVEAPVSNEEFAAFKLLSPVIEAQTMWEDEQAAYRTNMQKYHEALRAWFSAPAESRGAQPERPLAPPKSLDEAVDRGDYFHVHNTSDLRPPSQDTTGRARRIVVNVTSQQAGLKVAESLSGLFDDPAVSEYLDHYKIYLTKQTDEPSMKHDKLVVYYEVPPGTAEGKDDVGDRIAAAIDGSVDDNEVSDVFAPFYSRVGRGIAWAEEPESYVDDLVDSFTGTRASIIDDVLNDPDNTFVKDADEFIELVRDELDNRYVNRIDPHRHQAGNPPQERRINERRQIMAPKMVFTPPPLLAPPKLLIEPSTFEPLTTSIKPPSKVPAKLPPVTNVVG